MGPDARQPVSSLGSGFIISNDGYVITNNHVIADADEIIVRLNDRREFIASLVGVDAQTDIAVLKIDAKNLPVVKIGSSKALEVGEWVLAIGSPFGFDYSVTSGIVSAKGRSLPNENYIPFIQTDVAINPGNSGGPLFNLDGEAIGVNSQIYSRTGGFMGLSFAIPMDIVINVYEQIRNTGTVTRGWLGVMIQDVTRELAESFGMPNPEGALVAKVIPGSPAGQAGIRVGDIILDFNDSDIDMSTDLPPVVGTTKVGESVPVRILRAGKEKVLTVKINAMPGEEVVAAAPVTKTLKQAHKNQLNLSVEALSTQERSQLDLDDHGVIVNEVGEGPARNAGITAGDILLLIDNKKVIDSDNLRSITDSLPLNKAIPILIYREGGPMFLALKLTANK